MARVRAHEACGGGLQSGGRVQGHQEVSVRLRLGLAQSPRRLSPSVTRFDPKGGDSLI